MIARLVCTYELKPWTRVRELLCNNSDMCNLKLSIYAATQEMRECYNNNMCIPLPIFFSFGSRMLLLHALIFCVAAHILSFRLLHITIVACSHPLYCCIYTALVSLIFGTVIPTSFNILMDTCVHLVCSFTVVLCGLCFDSTPVSPPLHLPCKCRGIYLSSWLSLASP